MEMNGRIEEWKNGRKHYGNTTTEKPLWKATVEKPQQKSHYGKGTMENDYSSLFS